MEKVERGREEESRREKGKEREEGDREGKRESYLPAPRDGWLGHTRCETAEGYG